MIILYSQRHNIILFYRCLEMSLFLYFVLTYIRSTFLPFFVHDGYIGILASLKRYLDLHIRNIRVVSLAKES